MAPKQTTPVYVLGVGMTQFIKYVPTFNPVLSSVFVRFITMSLWHGECFFTPMSLPQETQVSLQDLLIDRTIAKSA